MYFYYNSKDAKQHFHAARKLAGLNIELTGNTVNLEMLATVIFSLNLLINGANLNTIAIEEDTKSWLKINKK